MWLLQPQKSHTTLSFTLRRFLPTHDLIKMYLQVLSVLVILLIHNIIAAIRITRHTLYITYLPYYVVRCQQWDILELPLTNRGCQPSALQPWHWAPLSCLSLISLPLRTTLLGSAAAPTTPQRVTLEVSSLMSQVPWNEISLIYSNILPIFKCLNQLSKLSVKL